MSQSQRLRALEARAYDEWLAEQAAAIGMSMDEARQQARVWAELLLQYRWDDDELVQLPEASIRAFLTDFSLAVAPDEDTEPYVSETLARWGRP